MSELPQRSAHVSVERSRCVGSGLCETMASQLFVLEPDGVSVPTQPIIHREEDIGNAQDAENACPTSAISLVMIEL